ncbi:hypothetical protein Pmani_036068 [Petrolisthes manimaculis]|uniref:TELO2-interacting protein 1 homolog n=1 Tax=Petrolisthes manimaculis TaxID=1843537 RepID=A0AAE1NKD7_9EUCA|nr:hypothetical protein Pmani_036068 [Petrolisthes manimaculis]
MWVPIGGEEEGRGRVGREGEEGRRDGKSRKRRGEEGTGRVGREGEEEGWEGEEEKERRGGGMRRVGGKEREGASVRVAKEGSVKSIRCLKEELKKVVALENTAGGGGGDGWTSCISDLKEYLLFPVIIILKTRPKCSQNLEEEIVSLIKTVVERSVIEDFKFFQEVFTQLFLLLTHRGSPSKVRETSEECKEAVLGAATCLLSGCGSDVRQQVYGDSFRPQLGHAIHLTLALATQEKSTAIKIQAIATLGAMSQMTAFPNLTHSDQQFISTTFTNFLPGVSMGLTKVATAGDTQNHKVTAAAIDVWCHVVVMVMRDSFLLDKVPNYGESDTLKSLRTQLALTQPRQSQERKQEVNSGKEEKKSKFDLPEPEEEKECVRPVVSVEVNGEWVRQTAERLQILVESLRPLVSHSHWRVRLSLVHWAHHLLTQCSRSLEGSVVVTIEVIAGLRSDEIEEVRSAAEDSLQSTRSELYRPGQHTKAQPQGLGEPQQTQSQVSEQQTQDRQGLIDILEERIFALATQLPRVCRQQDDKKTLSMVRGLGGCMSVLGERLRQVLASHSHSHRLLLALSCLLTLDTSHPNLLQEKISDLDLNAEVEVAHLPGKSFQYFRDIGILEEVGRLCQLVGKYGDLVATVDLCLHLLHHTTHTRKETLLLLTLILQYGIDVRKGVEEQTKEEREHVVRSTLEAALSPEIFNALLYINPAATDTSSSDSPLDRGNQTTSSLLAINKEGNLSVGEVRSNVVQVWCALDLLAACARGLGGEFVRFLSCVLCQVMEKAGEANLVVANAATNTLKEIAQAMDHNSVGELIQDSVPHFWYPLSLRLKRLSQYPSAPLVLQVCLQHAQLDVLAFTEELVGEVLTSLDVHHNSCANPLLRVLLVYVRAAARYESLLTSNKRSVNSDQCKIEENLTNECNMNSKLTNENINESTADPEYGAVAKFLFDYHKNNVTLKQCLENKSAADNVECESGSGSTNFQNLANQTPKNEESENVDNINEEDEPKQEIPRHIELVVEVLERCSHLLYLSERRTRLLLLDVVFGGCEALAGWEDQRLPVLHKLWKPLMLRLQDKDSAVVGRVVEVVAEMVRTSGEFLRRRCLTQVLPALVSFLEVQGIVSEGRGRSSGYYLSPSYRTQLQVLTKLPNMVESLMPGPSQLAQVVNVVASYCHIKQPTQICSTACAMLTWLAHKYPHHVWLALAHLQSPGIITPPSHMLHSIKVRGTGAQELPKEVMDLYNKLC